MKGINFTEPLFHKVVDGSKKMTRRIIPIPANAYGGLQVVTSKDGTKRVYALDENERPIKPGTDQEWVINPRYKVGETVYLKEPYSVDIDVTKDGAVFKRPGNVLYRFSLAGFENSPIKWDNKLFMPAKYARYFIKITDVRVERLQDISDEDCFREGIVKIDDHCFHNSTIPQSREEQFQAHSFRRCGKNYMYAGYRTATDAFAALINRIEGKETWWRNPFVFSYTFKLTEKNTM